MPVLRLYLAAILRRSSLVVLKEEEKTRCGAARGADG